MRVTGIFSFFAGLYLLVPGAAAAPTEAPAAAKTPLAVEEIAGGLEHPWALAFLPDGRFLVSERPGRLRIVTRDGQLSPPIAGLPKVVTGGQAGLFDVLPARDFATSGTLYFAYAEPREEYRNGTAVGRGKLRLDGRGGTLSGVEVIFRQQPAIASHNHFGGRLVWGRDGTLFITLGERASERDSAQDLSTHLGKVVRINADGTVPADNPFFGAKDVRPEIYSYGHRNPQGAALHPATGVLWTTEHGARGGDELNAIAAGKNYGWPVITWGVGYDGKPIGEGTRKDGMEQPVYYWTPSIATSGLSFYDGELFAGWKGNALIGGLAGGQLERLVLEGENVVGVEALLGDRKARVRDVRQGPDGAVYVLTDEKNGKLLRLSPR